MKKILVISIFLFAFSSPVFAGDKFTARSSGPVNPKENSIEYYKLSACSRAMVAAWKAGKIIARSSHENTTVQSDGKFIQATCTIYDLVDNPNPLTPPSDLQYGLRSNR